MQRNFTDLRTDFCHGFFLSLCLKASKKNLRKFLLEHDRVPPDRQNSQILQQFRPRTAAIDTRSSSSGESRASCDNSRRRQSRQKKTKPEEPSAIAISSSPLLLFRTNDPHSRNDHRNLSSPHQRVIALAIRACESLMISARSMQICCTMFPKKKHAIDDDDDDDCRHGTDLDLDGEGTD